MRRNELHPRGPTHTGDFFESEILAKSDFLGSMKDGSRVGSMGREKNRGIFLGCDKRTKAIFGYAKKRSDFLG